MPIWVKIGSARASDPDQKRADLDQLIKGRAITVNELRAHHGMEPLKSGGDALVNPAPGGAQQGGEDAAKGRSFREVRLHGADEPADGNGHVA